MRRQHKRKTGNSDTSRKEFKVEVLDTHYNPRRVKFLKALENEDTKEVVKLLKEMKEKPELEATTDILLELVGALDEGNASKYLKKAFEIDFSKHQDRFLNEDENSEEETKRDMKLIEGTLFRTFASLEPDDECPELLDAVIKIIEIEREESRSMAMGALSMMVDDIVMKLSSPGMAKRLFDLYIRHEDDELGEDVLEYIRDIYLCVADAKNKGYDTIDYEVVLVAAFEEMGYELRTNRQLREGTESEDELVSTVCEAYSKALPATTEKDDDYFSDLFEDAKGAMDSNDTFYIKCKLGTIMGTLKRGTVDKWAKEGKAEENLKKGLAGILKQICTNPVEVYLEKK